jgi:hypothetical protein
MHLPARWRTAVCSAAAALAAVALAAAPAAAETAAAPGCPVIPTVKPFAPWQDFADYFLAPNGNIEAGATSWLLTGGASAVEGNNSFRVGRITDHRSLRLPAGATATTAPICIGVEHRSIRFFAKAAAQSTLNVDAVIDGPGGSQRSVRIATLDGDDAWAPSDVIPMVVNELAAEQGNAIDVRLRFSPHGAGSWTIDDVFVDPKSH